MYDRAWTVCGSTYANGLYHFKAGKRAKSLSAEWSVAPCSMARDER